MAQTIGPDIFNHSIPKRTLENGFIENKWVRLFFQETSHPFDDDAVELYILQWAYLVSPDLTDKALSNFNADLSCDEHSALLYDNSFRRNIKDGFESIITVMNFEGIKPRRSQIRISEDLIHMFHLYETIDNEGNRNYTQFNDGEEKVVITVSKNEVKTLHQYLCDFLASKKMNLVCAIRSELNMPPSLTSYIGCRYTYTGPEGITDTTDDSITNFSIAITGGIEFQSWFVGKKIIPYKEFGEFKSSFDGDYAEFTIGYDTNTCENIKAKCNDDSLRYKKVYFKKGVLDKYRQDVNVTIGPNYISPVYFSLKCDNDRPDYIWAFLKDLRCLPYSEQLHWASYDMLPLETPPSDFYKESQISWNARSSSPDFVFRHLFTEVNRLWHNKFGWPLFKPTTGLQDNAIERVFVLGSNEPGYFRNLLLPFNLVLAESINVDELERLKFEIPKKDCGNILKLNYFLEAKGHKRNCFINFLLQLNTLRSEFSETHRNKSEYSDKMLKALDFIGLDVDAANYVEATINLSNNANEAFRWLIPRIDNLN